MSLNGGRDEYWMSGETFSQNFKVGVLKWGVSIDVTERF